MSPKPISCAEAPVALIVSGKSRAMRAGLVIENPTGGLATGLLREIFMITLEPRWLALIDWIAFSSATAKPEMAAKQTKVHCCINRHAAAIELPCFNIVIA
jgi:hypothetical protein